MNIFFDWMLLIITTVILLQSGKTIFRYKSVTLADFVVVTIYFFNVLPILLNYGIGMPNYDVGRWFSNFKRTYFDENIQIVYDIYILVTLISLKIYIYHINKKEKVNNRNKSYKKPNLIKDNTYDTLLSIKKYLIFIVCMLHIMFFILSTGGSISKILAYGTSVERGLNSSFYQISIFFELIGLVLYCWYFFCSSGKKKSKFLFFIYIFMIVWINGKRYIIVTCIIIIFYYYISININNKKSNKLLYIGIIFAVVFILFYYWYAVTFKPIDSTIDALYLTFRIDFGRDDVVKFVLYRELIDKIPILDYRMQTVLGTIFMWIPRFLWANKPYPHYRYLTAAIYDMTIYKIPSGMTPSLFEMIVSNFGVLLGILITPFILIYICTISDRENSILAKSLYLLISVGLLTQSPDSFMGIILIAVIHYIYKRFKVICK